MNILSKLLFFSLCFFYTQKFCIQETAGFTTLNIHSTLPNSPDWDVANPPLMNIFDQRFTYLGAGGQCYAFVSDDGKYVLKFFKHHLRRVPFWLAVIPLPEKWKVKRERQKEKRLNKLKRDFRSYKLAIEKLPEETGLLYVHLNKNNDLTQVARIVDKLGIEHQIDLNSVNFMLQKKASMAYPHLIHLIKQNRLQEAKEAVESICSLIINRCEKGIYDEDAKIHRNFGFIENKAILIDVGRLKYDPQRQNPKIQQEDLFEITYRFKQFLDESSPELANHLQDYLARRLDV